MARTGRRGRLFVAFERIALGAGMAVAAFFIERRLVKAIRGGAIRTKAAPEPPAEPREAQVNAAP